MSVSEQPLLVAAFYKFVALPDREALKRSLLALCEREEVRGTILLAPEGINGTIAGARTSIEGVLQFLRNDQRFADLEHKESMTKEQPFARLKVRLKREIITMNVPSADPTQLAGQYVEARDWNRLIDDPDVVVVDVRNDYEVALGSFKGALNPRTKSFSELSEWLEAQPQLKPKPKVAMFCTGGIRCEKSTALLRSRGFDEVYHLRGGILKYLETVPEAESRFEGVCFVFDERVAVGHGLRTPDAELCRSCCEPIRPEDRASERYVPGLACPKCFDSKSPETQRRLRERRRQLLP